MELMLSILGFSALLFTGLYSATRALDSETIGQMAVWNIIAAFCAVGCFIVGVQTFGG